MAPIITVSIKLAPTRAKSLNIRTNHSLSRDIIFHTIYLYNQRKYMILNAIDFSISIQLDT